MSLPFADRPEAGRQLAKALQQPYAGRRDLIVLALPRGGVPVAFEVAQALHAPLDLMIVRKLGFPGQSELAMGAIATGDVVVMNDQVLRMAYVPREIIDETIAHERSELRRRELAYRGHRPPPDVRGKTVIVIDDGLATGSTMLAAVKALRQQGPASIVVAVPVGPADTVESFRGQADDVVCPATPANFGGVGRWYEDFNQTTDEEVRELLDRAWHEERLEA